MHNKKYILFILILCIKTSGIQCFWELKEQEIEEPSKLVSLVAVVSVGVGVTYLAVKLYRYFTSFGIEDSRRLCEEATSFLRNLDDKYSRAFEFIENEKGIIELKNNLQKIIAEQLGEYPYYAYVALAQEKFEKVEYYIRKIDHAILAIGRSRDLKNKRLEQIGVNQAYKQIEQERQFCDQELSNLHEIKRRFELISSKLKKIIQIGLSLEGFQSDRAWRSINKRSSANYTVYVY